MHSLQLIGPRSEDAGPVRHHTMFLRSQGENAAGLFVTINLGEKLRRCVRGAQSDTDEGIPKAPQTSQQRPYSEPPVRANREPSTAKQRSQPSLPTDLSTQTAPATPVNLNFSSNGASYPAHDDGRDLDSDLEILEVRSLQPDTQSAWGKNGWRKVDLDTDSETTAADASSDLSSLDYEVNHALSSAATDPIDPSQKGWFPDKRLPSTTRPQTKELLIQKLLPDFYRPHKASEGPLPPGYRSIPPNLVYAIDRELKIAFDTSTDDELEVVEKLVFSLKDPISKTKIKLPVKSTACSHFECFDFETFCDFHQFLPHLRDETKETLMNESTAAKKLEKQLIIQQQQLAAGKLRKEELIFPYFSEHGQMFFFEVKPKAGRLYKCPLCDGNFGLKQLYISDIFNYFVKSTPSNITKIELEGTRFKIVEDEKPEVRKHKFEVVSLSDEDDDDDEVAHDEVTNNGAKSGMTGESRETSVLSKTATEITGKAKRSTTADDFNDGLDDVLLNFNNGDGSYHHPLTLD
ncbi:MIZ/SP-RING zinc finger [Metschnikowia aff. pulcherrima]|uniref:MIZ/SP-RING zinc finger n=1 Tax=Metschnikowia aff. pulcherrima TaxID=2163413 RepID=A0A4V1ADV8_9ASCO|nr:MIZ/SP-RING zinc finger [Metschnikowia aff. pulcherrima]